MGIKAITPHLIIDGASDAIAFYTKAFGAVEHYRMADPNGKLWHAQIGIGNVPIMLADEFPEMGGGLGPNSMGGSPVVLHLQVDDCDAAFDQAVAAGATPTMPPADMFWGDRYATVTDPFGHRWSIAQTKESLTPDQMLERGQAAMAAMNGEPCGAAAQTA